jgi:hypothetical protein
MRVGDKVVIRGVEGRLVHIDENPNTGLPYLTVTYKDGRSRAEWVSEKELTVPPKFKVGEMVKDGFGTEYFIASICEASSMNYPMLGIRNINKHNAYCESFTIDGRMLRDCGSDDPRNLIPN